MLSMVFGMSDAAADAVANGAFQVYSWDELSDDIEIVDVNANPIYQYIKAERSMSIKKIVADVCSPRECDIVFRYFGFLCKRTFRRNSRNIWCLSSAYWTTVKESYHKASGT